MTRLGFEVLDPRTGEKVRIPKVERHWNWPFILCALLPFALFWAGVGCYALR